MAKFQPFQLERIMSEWESAVDYNLSESGAHPVTLGDLLDGSLTIDDLLATELNYPQVDGTLELREGIAALYTGAKPDNVLVTVGCAEANFITVQTILEPGDEMVVTDIPSSKSGWRATGPPSAWWLLWQQLSLSLAITWISIPRSSPSA